MFCKILRSFKARKVGFDPCMSRAESDLKSRGLLRVPIDRTRTLDQLSTKEV
jgi:hypothetical protein